MNNPYKSSTNQVQETRTVDQNSFLLNALVSSAVAVVLTNCLATTIRVLPLIKTSQKKDAALEWALTFFWNCFDSILMLMFFGACAYKLQQKIPAIRSVFTVCLVVALVSFALGVPKVAAKGVGDSTTQYSGYICSAFGCVLCSLIYLMISNMRRLTSLGSDLNGTGNLP
jgi:hypothetical protein